MTLPGAARALGLGDIRINSALNEPLAAQIDIVGASPDELDTLRVQMADTDVFRRHGADRPPYLSTVTFKVGLGAQGHPVLEVRSTAPFADPVVSFLVDIRWRSGELIRDYSLLLDPASLASGKSAAGLDDAAAVSATVPAALPAPMVASVPAEAAAPVAAAAPAFAGTPTAAGPAATAAAAGKSIASPYRVRARDTLHGIARRAGAGTRVDEQRMMIAVFQANPQAFDGNINLLHRGAMLTMPTAKDVAALNAAEASREVAEQMSAWRHSAAQAAMPPTGVPRAAGPDSVGDAGDLNRKVRSLQDALDSVHLQLAFTDAAIRNLQQLTALPPVTGGAETAVAQASAATPAVPAPASAPIRVSTPVKPGIRSAMVDSVTLAMGMLCLAVALLRRRRPVAVAVAAAAPVQVPDADATIVEEITLPSPLHDVPLHDVMTAERAEGPGKTVELPAGDTGGSAEPGITGSEQSPHMDTVILEGAATEETVLDIPTAGGDLKRARSTVLDYNLVDLDSSATHIHMPSDLNDRAGFTERRTSIIDALQAAIARDPHRSDLRMKLLETYYSLAAANRRAFLEFAHRQAREGSNLSDEDWRKVAAMGREIAPDDSLFTDKGADSLADCA